jgi:hypothetical protein
MTHLTDIVQGNMEKFERDFSGYETNFIYGILATFGRDGKTTIKSAVLSLQVALIQAIIERVKGKPDKLPEMESDQYDAGMLAMKYAILSDLEAAKEDITKLQ